MTTRTTDSDSQPAEDAAALADTPRSISPAEAAQLVAEGGAAHVIDVRSGLEFDTEHVPGSRLLPLAELARRVEEVRATPGPRLLLCRTGVRAATASQTLHRLGVSDLGVIEGGIEAYARAGGEIVKGEPRMSLERQVRVAAGALVLGSVVLAVLLHPGFVFLAAFVGAGLVFAGLTDWCGMGLLLARAPWNRGSADAE